MSNAQLAAMLLRGTIYAAEMAVFLIRGNDEAAWQRRQSIRHLIDLAETEGKCSSSTD